MNNNCNPSFEEDENFVFKIKKSDFKNLFNGGLNLNISINKESVSKSNILLSKREMQVLKMLAQGKTNTKIAKELVISPYTVKAHVANILQKLKVKDRVQAAVKATAQKIIDI